MDHGFVAGMVVFFVPRLFFFVCCVEFGGLWILFLVEFFLLFSLFGISGVVFLVVIVEFLRVLWFD